MGGSGSGRHTMFSGRNKVEDSLVLSVSTLARGGMIRVIARPGSLVWTNTRTGERTASVGYTCVERDGAWTSTLIYTATCRGEKSEVTLPITLQTTRPRFGGVRWWFTCPLLTGGRACRRRVAKLYLPPGGVHFGCRHCHDLTYTSCQESHKYDRLWREIAAGTGCTSGFVKTVLDRHR